MTYNELKNDVLKLGFESVIEDEDSLLYAARRALSLLYIDRPVSKKARLFVSSPRLAFGPVAISHRAGEINSLPVDRCTLSFRASSDGYLTVKDDTQEIKRPFFASDGLIRVEIKNGGWIMFSGDYDYSVYNLAGFYGIPLDKTPEYTEKKEIDLTLILKDFRSFSGLPTSVGGQQISGAVLQDGKIYLPFSFEGEIEICYYRLPDEITGQSDGTVDVMSEAEPLLPLLTAFFLWLDDDAEKAQYYLSLYRETLARIMRYSTRGISNEYVTNGWA